MRLGEKGPPNLAERLLDLSSLGIPGSMYKFNSGQELVFRVELSPSAASRIYTCELHVPPGKTAPKLIVIEPDLKVLAEGRKLPHTYPYAGKGVWLCLWKPKFNEWNWRMRLSDTYIPWALQWLWYFEDWLHSDDWAGGGDHPNGSRVRYGVQTKQESNRHFKLRKLIQST